MDLKTLQLLEPSFSDCQRCFGGWKYWELERIWSIRRLFTQ